MRITVSHVIILVFLVIGWGNLPVFAANWEIHPGLYTSYEYSDNYLGEAEEEQEETTYEIGPSLELIVDTQHFHWEVAGYAAKSYHREFDEDDATEVSTVTSLAWAGVRRSLDMKYEYTQTRSRESLDQPIGETRIHRGSVTYHRDISRRISYSAGYRTYNEDAPEPDDDVSGNGGVFELTYLPNPRNRLDLTYSYDIFNYDADESVEATELSLDSRITAADIGWLYAISRRVSMGPTAGYSKIERPHLNDEATYTLELSMVYTPSRNLNLDLAAGYSRLKVDEEEEEIEDTEEGVYIYRAGLTWENPRDTITAGTSRGYTTETTSYRYGIYRTNSADISWEHKFANTLSSEITALYTQRKPSSDIADQDEEEKEFVGQVAGIWSPWEYLDLRLYYERLEQRFEVSDTVKENRYGAIIEIRY